jgi:Nuclease-related domain
MTSTDEATANADFAGTHALSLRGAGYAVALKCLQVQAHAEARDPSLHSGSHVTLHPDAWPWYTGALGEIEVGRLLTALGPEWFVRHAVPIGADLKDVDHLVIGPGGVYVINTKHHQGKSVWVGDYVVRINKTSVPYISIAQGDGLDVARRLTNKVGFPVAVTSVIAVLHARSLVDGRLPHNRRVAVVDAQHLARWILAQPRTLDDGDLALIKHGAEDPQTWHVDPHAADTLRVLQRFERLAAQIGDAPARRARVARPLKAAPRRSPATKSTDAGPTRRSRGKKTTSSNLLKLCLAVGAVIASFAWILAVVR